MKEFFGFGGYTRAAEGYMSWQHLLFVGFLLVAMVILAVVLGKQRKDLTHREKNKVLIVSALLMDGLEILKIVVLCLRAEPPSLEPITRTLPLFLCSIQLIALPMAAFTKGRLQEASTDFVCIFGILGAVLGTVGAGQNYNAYPVLSMDNVISGLTHCIAGFASLYILFARMASMKKSNMVITLGILTGFCIAAYIANITLDYNYMFLMAGDGTPYDILYNLVGGHKVFYPVSVVALFFVYILVYYWVFYRITHKSKKAVPAA